MEIILRNMVLILCTGCHTPLPRTSATRPKSDGLRTRSYNIHVRNFFCPREELLMVNDPSSKLIQLHALTKYEIRNDQAEFQQIFQPYNRNRNPLKGENKSGPK